MPLTKQPLCNNLIHKDRFGLQKHGSAAGLVKKDEMLLEILKQQISFVLSQAATLLRQNLYLES